MANQNEPRFHLSVKVDAVPTIIARTAAVVSVVATGPGVFVLTHNAPIGEAEEVHAMCVEAEPLGEGGFAAQSGCCERLSDTQYRIRTFDQTGAPTNAGFSFTMYRVDTRS